MSVQIENYLFMMVLYILCFIYIFSLRTEYVCLILLICLNLFYVLLFLSDINKSVLIQIFIYKIPVRIIILLLWLLLMVSNNWLINTFRILRAKFTNSDTGIDLGSKKNHKTKNQIILLLVCSVILLLFLHLLSISVLPTLNPATNVLTLIIIVVCLILTSITIHLNDELSSNTRIITTQT
jgi:hypothetical protein